MKFHINGEAQGKLFFIPIGGDFTGDLTHQKEFRFPSGSGNCLKLGGGCTPTWGSHYLFKENNETQRHSETQKHTH